jgi:hypothetical protein
VDHTVLLPTKWWCWTELDLCSWLYLCHKLRRDSSRRRNGVVLAILLGPSQRGWSIERPMTCRGTRFGPSVQDIWSRRCNRWCTQGGVDSLVNCKCSIKKDLLSVHVVGHRVFVDVKELREPFGVWENLIDLVWSRLHAHRSFLTINYKTQFYFAYLWGFGVLPSTGRKDVDVCFAAYLFNYNFADAWNSHFTELQFRKP